MENPFRIHHSTLHHVIQYVHMSQGVLFHFDSHIHFEEYTDADWVSCLNSRHSIIH